MSHDSHATFSISNVIETDIDLELYLVYGLYLDGTFISWETFWRSLGSLLLSPFCVTDKANSNDFDIWNVSHMTCDAFTIKKNSKSYRWGFRLPVSLWSLPRELRRTGARSPEYPSEAQIKDCH